MPDLPPADTVLSPGLRRLTAVVRALVLLGALALCVVPAAFWLSPEWVRDAAPSLAGVPVGAVTIDARALVLGALASAPGVAAGFWMLWRLWQLFGEYRAGRVFGPVALLSLRGFARALLLCSLLAPLQRAAVGVALTLGNPPGQRLLVLGVGWPDYVGLLLGATLLVIASVMAEAARLAEDNRGFV